MREIVDNITFAFQDITNEARWGGYFTCGSEVVDDDPTPCPEGSQDFSFISVRDLPENAPYITSPNPVDPTVVKYSFNNGVLEKAYNENNYQPLISPAIQIEDLTFYVYGNATDDLQKARILVVVTATIDVDTKTESSIVLQTTITQRLQD